MSRRTRCSAFAVLGLALILSMSAAAQQSTITVITAAWNGQGWIEYVQSAAEGFMAIRPDVKVEVLVTDNPQEAYIVRVAGGVSADLIEVWTGLAYEGYFLDLRPYMEADAEFEWDDYYSTEEFFGLDGEIWSIPTNVYSTVTFYNRDVLQRAGLADPHQLGDAWTWETALSMAPKLTQDRDGDGTTDQYFTDRVAQRWYTQVAQAGGEPYNRFIYPDEARFNTPGVRQGLEYILEHIERGFSPHPTFPRPSDFYFWQGKTAVSYVDGPGILGTGYLPGVSFDWDIAPHPKGPDNNGSALIIPATFKVAKQSKHPQETYDFLRYLTSPDSLLHMARNTGFIPANKMAAQEYLRYGSNLPDNAFAFLEVAANPASHPLHIQRDSRVSGIESELLNRVWRQELPIQSAVEQLDARINAIFAEIKAY